MGQHADFDKITVERSSGMAGDNRDERNNLDEPNNLDRRDNRDKSHDCLDCFFP